MRDITKRLTITRLEIHHRAEGRYLLGLTEPGTWPEVPSTLTLTAEDMIRFGLDPGEELVGTTLDLTLKAVPYLWETPLSPDDWETAFAESVARIDAILKERYDNRLPMEAVREFYDNIETSTWESTERHPIEELSVGLQAKYVFREHCHLPSIIIEARSVAGNRKACQAVCEVLSREAADLFGVRFEHISTEIEEMVEKETPQS